MPRIFFLSLKIPAILFKEPFGLFFSFIFPFKYCDEKGNINEENNPNGSLNNIAGILNDKKNILGMMPHPERMIDQIISNNDGVNLFASLLN